MSNFITVSVDGNVHALVIAGHPDIEDLYKAWEKIGWQFADAIKDSEYTMYSRLSNEVLQLEIDYKRICMLVEALKIAYCDKFKDKLNQLLGTKMKFNVHDKASYDKDIRSAKTRSTGIMINIELKRASLEALEPANKNSGKKVTREYFQSMLISLSDYAEYRITDSITVFEYCERIHRLNEHYKRMKSVKYGK